MPRENILILEYIGKHGRITTAQALELTAIPRPTVRLRLSQLVEAGLLEAKGQGRGAFYVKSVKLK